MVLHRFYLRIYRDKIRDLFEKCAKTVHVRDYEAKEHLGFWYYAACFNVVLYLPPVNICLEVFSSFLYHSVAALINRAIFKYILEIYCGVLDSRKLVCNVGCFNQCNLVFLECYIIVQILSVM